MDQASQPMSKLKSNGDIWHIILFVGALFMESFIFGLATQGFTKKSIVYDCWALNIAIVTTHLPWGTEAIICSLLVLVLFRVSDFKDFLYKDSRTQKKTLFLVPKYWLSRASGYQLLFTTFILGRTGIHVFLVITCSQVSVFLTFHIQRLKNAKPNFGSCSRKFVGQGFRVLKLSTYTTKGQAYICFCSMLVLYREPGYQHFLYKYLRTQRKMLVLVPRNWLPRASGLSKVLLFSTLLHGFMVDAGIE